MPATAYATCGDLSLAYQVFGDGPHNLVFAGSFVSHVEVMWTSPETKAWFDELATFCRVLIFDKAGVGLSDPVPKVRSIDDRAAELEAVMDAAGFDRATILGISEGGPASIVFAASRPDRVQSLILTGTYPGGAGLSFDDATVKPEDLVDRFNDIFGAKYAVTVDQVRKLQAFWRGVDQNWGSGDAMELMLPSVRSRQLLGTLERMSASPGMARATVLAGLTIDVRATLPAIRVPTLVIHARDDLLPIQYGRYLADHIPGARLVEFDGRDHAPWFSSPDDIAHAIREFLTGARAAPSTHRALRTLLFTDMVSSTQRAASMGDDRWRALVERFNEITAEAAARFGGTVIKNMGDGHLATFDGPTQGIRCAQELQSATTALDIDVRSGVHTGECELIGDDVGGIAVHIAARIMAAAGAGEILVTSAVRDLVVGSGIGFDDRGIHELRGVPGEWRVLAVEADGARPGTREADLARAPTPGASTAMRRRDRAAAVMVRRSPRLMRGVARVLPALSRR